MLMSLWFELKRLVAAAPAQPVTQMERTGQGPKGASSPGVYSLAERAELEEANKEMRALLQRTGTALGVAAVAILGGLGYARLHDIFPIPKNVPSWTQWASLAAIATAFLGSAILSARFFAAQRRILIGSDLSGLAWPSRKRARPILQDFASEEEARDIVDVDLRAIRLDRIAHRLEREGNVEHAAVQAEADRLGAFVDGALGSAATHLLESRTKAAFFGLVTAISFLLAVSGTVASFGFADYFKSQRDLATLRADCLKAEESGVIDACAPYETKARQDAKRQDAAARAKLRVAEFARARSKLSPSELSRIDSAKSCIDYVLSSLAPISSLASVRNKLLDSCVS
jgi:hypothetical protein